MHARALASLLLLPMLCLVLAGCSGDGLFFPQKTVSTDGGDVPDADDTEEPEPTPTPDTTTSLGTWLAAFGDDRVESAAREGSQQYVARLKLQRDGSVVSGTGKVFRFYESGTRAYRELAYRVSGTISGDDVTVTEESYTGGTVYDALSWRLRIASRYMVGMYVGEDFDGDVVRSGHAVWHKQSSADLSTYPWITAFTDAYGRVNWPRRDRTGVLLFNEDPATGALTGAGSFVEQRDGATPFEVGFNVTSGYASDLAAEFTLGELELLTSPMDWYAFYTAGYLNSVMVSAYAQFDVNGAMARHGTATWYTAPDAGPDAIHANWMVAFSDANPPGDGQYRDYLARVLLKPQEDNTVTGSGTLYILKDGEGRSESVSVEDGIIVGSRVTLDLRVKSSREIWTWDLRLGKKIMPGSYQHFDGADRFLTRGAAVWRGGGKTTVQAMAGTWAAAYFDSYEVDSDPTTQFALVTINEPPEEGSEDENVLTGFGALRYGTGATGRRLFNLIDSEIEDFDIAWTWRSPDLFGDTTWRLHRATGSILVGVYFNETSAGRLESQGHGLWFRTSMSDAF